jgi:Protein of unknown function (DUF3800)
MMVLTAFVDDSGSDTQGPAYVLAGYVSDVDSWEKFSVEWQRILDEHPRICYFKMSEAESRRGCFAGWDREDITNKIHTFIPVINKYVKCIIECVFWQEHYDVAMSWFLAKMLPLVEVGKKELLTRFGNPYFLAFCMIMKDYSQRLEMEHSDDIVDFIFDTQEELGEKAVGYWMAMREFFPEKYRKYIPNEPVHRDEKIFLPLQAADLIAWQTRRRLEDLNIRKIKEKRKRPKRTVLLSVHEWVKWTLPQVWI